MRTYHVKLAVIFILASAALLSCKSFPKEVDYGDKVVFQAHIGKVLAVEISPDSRRLASGGTDGVAKIWDLKSSNLLYVLPSNTPAIYTVTFSPDGRLLASGSHDQIQIWSMATGELLRTITGHPNAIYSLAFSPDGLQLASAGPDPNLRVWSMEQGSSDSEPLHIITGHQGAIYSVTYSSDSRYILSASFDQTVWFSDARTGLPAKYFKGHTAPVMEAIFEPTGKYVLSAGSDGTIKAWDIETTKEYKSTLINKVEGHDTAEEIWAMAFLPHTDYMVAIGGREGYIRFWNYRTRKRKRDMRLDYGDIWDIDIDATGSIMAVACEDEVVLIYTLLEQ